MPSADSALIGWPIYSDVGVRLTPTLTGGSWVASLPLTNLQKPELSKVARSTNVNSSSTRFRVDLQEAKQVRCLGLLYRSPDRTGAPSTAARFRFLGIPTSAQGVLFDYEAGDDLTALGATFARTGSASYVDSTGVLRSAATGVPRDSHFINGTRVLLLEPASTNLVLQSENFGTTWTTLGTPTRTPAAHTASGVSLDLIGDDSAAVQEFYSQTIGFTGNGVKAVSVFLKKGTSPAASGASILLQDATAVANRLYAVITWSGTVPSVAMNTGTYLGAVPLADGVYRLLFATTSVTAANTNNFLVLPADTSTQQGNVYAGGAQAENATVPTSYVKTTTATVTRNADSLSFAYTAAPQAASMYLDTREVGFGLAANSTAVVIGTTSTTGPFWVLQGDGSGGFSASYKPASTTRASTVATGAAWHDRVELLATLTSSGVETLSTSKNGAAAVAGSATTADALPGAWQATTILLSPGSPWVGAGVAVASLRILQGVKTLAEMQAAAYDSGWLTPFPAGKTSDDTEGLTLMALAFPASTVPLLRYIYVDIDDATNAAGFIDVNRFIATGIVQASQNMSVGAAIGLETGTTSSDAESSATFYVRRPTRRSVTCVFDEQADADADPIFDFQRIAGIDRQFLFVWDPSDSARLWRRAFLATLRQLSKFEANIGNRWGIPHEIREVL